MPGLEIDRKGSRTLATLIDLASRIIEDAEHRHDTGGLAIGTLDLGILATNVVNTEANATGPLRDLRTVPEGLVDSLNAVVVHLNEKAR